MSIRSRVLIILGLVALAIFTLIPRTVTIRRRDPATGAMRDTSYRRVPIKYGLDLQGGMYIALEVDESHGVVANKSEVLRFDRVSLLYPQYIRRIQLVLLGS